MGGWTARWLKSLLCGWAQTVAVSWVMLCLEGTSMWRLVVFNIIFQGPGEDDRIHCCHVCTWLCTGVAVDKLQGWAAFQENLGKLKEKTSIKSWNLTRKFNILPLEREASLHRSKSLPACLGSSSVAKVLVGSKLTIANNSVPVAWKRVYLLFGTQ